MELRHLRCFQAVAEELSCSRGARRLHVTQPALSRAVKDVGFVLGTRVLERSRHLVRLTPASSVLLRETASLVERYEETLRREKRAAAGEEGELRLGCIGPPTQPILGRLVHEYRRRHPLAAVHLEERSPERVWEIVRRGRLRLGLTRTLAANEKLGLKTFSLRDEPLGIVVPLNRPPANRRHVAWPAITPKPLIVISRREGMSLHDAVRIGCREAGSLLVWPTRPASSAQ